MTRYYKYTESYERLPRIANYYKNYLKFFCNPVFKNFQINYIVKAFGECKAELYYKNNYAHKEVEQEILPIIEMTDKEKLFNTTIKYNIDNDSLTKTEMDVDQSSVINIKENHEIENSRLLLNDLSNYTSKSYQATIMSKEDSFIANLLKNLNTNKNFNNENYNVELMTRNKQKFIPFLSSLLFYSK